MTRSARVVNTLMDADPDFVALCELLYGPGVDSDEVYNDVFSKRGSQLTKDEKKQRLQRRVATASNLVGLTAGAAAIGSTLRDDRLKTGGKVARGLHRTGQRIPAPIARLSRRVGPKGAGRLAVGAAGLQLANVAGDVVVSQTLPKDKIHKAVPIPKLVEGIVASTKGMLQPTGKHVAPVPPGGNPETNAKIGQVAANLRDKPGKALFGTPKRAAASGAAGTYVATRPGKKKARLKGQQEGYQAGVLQKNDSALEVAGVFSKFDDDKRQAFGFASVVKKNGMPVIDRQGDYIDEDEMEKAAYLYVQKSRVGGDMHRRNRDEYGIDKAHHVSDLIESMVFTPEKCQAMGLSPEVSKQLEGHWWVGYQIHDEDTWQEVRKNGRTGFSIHGRGKRTDTSVDELMKGI